MALFSPKINVKGLTITGGNVGLKHCLNNAKNLLNAFGKSETPIYVGSALPFTKWTFEDDAAEGFHGENGLSTKIQDYLRTLPAPVQEVGKSFLDLYNGLKAQTTPVNYFVTGPCTTLALLIKVFPDVMEKIERIIIMGGSFSYGNITPYAEFNTWCDPESYQVLLGCPLEKVVFGLEPLDMLMYQEDFIQHIQGHPSKHSWLIAECYRQIWVSHFKFLEDHIMAEAPTIYDAGLIPFLTTMDYAQVSDANCKVHLDGDKRGMTEYELVEKSNCNMKVCTSVSSEKFKDFLEDALNQSALEGGVKETAKGGRMRLFTGDTNELDETASTPTKKKLKI